MVISALLVRRFDLDPSHSSKRVEYPISRTIFGSIPNSVKVDLIESFGGGRREEKRREGLVLDK